VGGLIYCLSSLFLSGAPQLQVRSVGGSRPFADPTNVVVAPYSDLILRVECAYSNGTGMETLTWQYQNDTEVPSGLQAFGVSQDNGELRVNPVTELMNANEFVCSSVDEESLAVTFTLGKCQQSY